MTRREVWQWDRYIADAVILALNMQRITTEQDQALVKAVAVALRELRTKRVDVVTTEEE